MSHKVYKDMGWLSIGVDKEDIRIYNAGHCARDARADSEMQNFEKNTERKFVKLNLN